MSTVFTMPGKLGDSLHQWPIAYHYGKQRGPFEVWMDEKTCAPLVPLFEAQPRVTKVKLIGGVENYGCGGQPFHMNLPTSDFQNHTVYHLGMRAFPVRQLTLECQQVSKVPITVDAETLASEPCISVASLGDKVNRLVLHGQAVYAHTNNSPTFWKFIAGIRGELEGMFDEIIFVGAPRDIEVGKRTYPGWGQFEDHGDFLKLAGYLSQSRAMIACGSAPVVLAGMLKVPAIRVHDPIANDAPKVIWSNLGENQLNETEIGLRTAWPKFKESHLGYKPLAVG